MLQMYSNIGALKIINVNGNNFVGVINHHIVRGVILETNCPSISFDGMNTNFFTPHYILDDNSNSRGVLPLSIEHKDNPLLFNSRINYLPL